LVRLARVEPDDRTTLRGECETFRLAIQIAEPLCILRDIRSRWELKNGPAPTKSAPA